MKFQNATTGPNKGKPYADRTINARCHSLRSQTNGIPSLAPDVPNPFACTSPEDWKSARLKIENIPNFKEIDKKESGKFANAMNLYGKFLSDTIQPVTTDIALNSILYGPPGTGKTYSVVPYAVAIIENKPLADIKKEADEDYAKVYKRYLKYKDDGLIAFTTFHQSFGYEEFIEGIRPVVTEEEGSESGRDIKYEIHDGIFKSFCDKAGIPLSAGDDVDWGIGKNPTVWKVSLEGTGDNKTRADCMKNNHIRIAWDEYGETISDAMDYSKKGGKNVLNAFYNGMQIGDIVLSCYSARTIDAIGVIVGDPVWNDEYPNYKRLRSVKWLAKGLNENIVAINGGKTLTLSSVYKLSVSVLDIIQLLRKNKALETICKVQNRVFIIDEINRGNISKIFGELITLIEKSKRIGEKEEIRTKLPYSGQDFGVPENVYILGTMNTADRSIALIDTALRRRFSFTEMQPDFSVLSGISVGDLAIDKMLETLNKRITALYDREHTIGHSFFLPLKERQTLDKLAEIFENKIIPLLQEYFHDDYEKIRLVLGDNQKDGKKTDTHFIEKKEINVATLFGNTEKDIQEYSYQLNKDASKNKEAYAKLQ
jgi:5-methylcytosine-specific restriction protein B